MHACADASAAPPLRRHEVHLTPLEYDVVRRPCWWSPSPASATGSTTGLKTAVDKEVREQTRSRATTAHGRTHPALVQCPPMRAVGSHPGTDLTVSVSRDEGVALVALGGRLDADTIGVVRGQIEQLLEERVR